jgi:hypothetical protein
MADPVAPAPELPLTGGTVAPVAAPVPSMSAESPAPEPIAVPPAADVVVKEPAVSEPVKTVAETPTLLEEIGADDKPKAEEKPVEAKPAEKPAEAKPEEVKPAEVKAEEKPAEVKPAEPVKPEPVAYEYALPETIKMDDALKGTFHTALDSFRADPAKGAQGLIDLHNQTMTDYANHLAAEQQRVFSETRKDWRKQVMADEQLGGSGYQTTMKAVARMRDLAVPEKDRASFNEFLRITGAGDHPAFLKAMHNFARFFDEAPLPPPNPSPPPNNGRQPGKRVLYDHPRSAGSRQ